MATANTKTAAKAAKPAKVKPFKVGSKVTFIRRNGKTAEGVVDKIEAKINGTWAEVNTGTKKVPDMTVVRESALIHRSV